jgi:hypothetical protein
MILHQPVDLGASEEIIRSHIMSSYVNKKEAHIMSKVLSLDKDLALKSFLYEQLKDKLGQPKCIPKSVIIFGVKPEASIRIHVDGYNLARDNASNYALNIPLEHSDLGIMHWYSGNYTLTEEKTDEKLQYLKLTWNEAPTIIDSTIINVPKFVRVDVPHNVVNHSPNHRLVLSIRFEPDLVVN